MKKTVFALVAASTLTACMGYTPLYAPIKGEVSSVYVDEVRMTEVEHNVGERRVAQIVANQLRQMFHGESSSDYAVDVSIKETKSTLAVRRDATDQRLQIDLRATVKLSKDGDQVFETILNSDAAYNVEDSPFGTDQGREQARESAARELSDSIIRRIALFLSEQDKAK